MSHIFHTLVMAKGTIKETQPGVWRVRVDAGADPVTGKRIQLSRVVRGGVRAAEDALRRLHKEAADGKRGRQSASVGELLDQWLANSRSTLSPKSIQNYSMRIEKQLRPTIGHIPVEKLTARHLDQLYRGLADKGASVYVIRQAHATIRAALSQALRWGEVDRNVAMLAKVPTIQAKPATAPSPSDVSQIVSHAEKRFGRQMAAFFALAAVTGARRGEILGLRRSDADLKASLLTIRRSITSTTADGVIVKGTKTGKVRRVALDDLGVQVIEAQLAELQANVEAGFDLIEDPYLFAGEPSGASTWFPDWPTQAFRKVCDDLGMSWHLHQLRHFTATQLIAAGVDVRTVSGRLGHADPSITLRVYSHVIEAKDREAAHIMGGLLKPATNAPALEQEKVRSKRLLPGGPGK